MPTGVVRRGVSFRFPSNAPGPGGPYNANAYLILPTPDGTGQATHPDIIDFGVGPFNGYRYWMGVTPFANSDSSLENPCILVSNDNSTWTIPPGGSNPIDPTPSTGYNSDPDLLYGQDGVLYLFYRQTQGSPAGDVIYCRSSSNGTTWSAEVLVLNTGANTLLSPTVYWDGTQYVMYVVDITVAGDPIMRRTCATPTGTWSAPAAIGITFPGNRTAWHIDAFKNGTKTYLTINEGVSGAQGINLSVASSTDNGLNYTVSVPLLYPLAAPLERTRVYRGCGAISGSTFRLWYSAQGDYGWRCAYTEMSLGLLP